MRVISDDGGYVRLACPACGAQRTVGRFKSRLASGRERYEPEEGQWLPCQVCQEWSPVEHEDAATALR
jgi:uncharacterized protein YbaR (Trm112 family)